MSFRRLIKTKVPAIVSSTPAADSENSKELNRKLGEKKNSNKRVKKAIREKKQKLRAKQLNKKFLNNFRKRREKI